MKKENISKILLFIAAMIWGSGFPATKIILDSGIKPYEFLSIRFILTALIMLIIIGVRGTKPKNDEIKLGLMAGFILFLAFALQTIGLEYTTSSKNAFITGANVIFVPYIMWMVTKEKPKLLYFICSIICFIGIAFLSIDADLSINFGDFLTFICAICFAFQIVIVGNRISGKNSFVVNSFQMLVAGLIAILMNILFEDSSMFTRLFTLKQSLALGYLVIFNTFICYSIQTYAQKLINPSQVSLILTSEIIFGAIFSVLLLNDKMNLQTIIGGILIFSSIILLEIRKSKK